MVKTLWQELCAQGFTGSYKSVWLFTRQWSLPQAGTSVRSVPKGATQQPRTPWQTKWLLLRAPDEQQRHSAYRGFVADLVKGEEGLDQDQRQINVISFYSPESDRQKPGWYYGD